MNAEEAHTVYGWEDVTKLPVIGHNPLPSWHDAVTLFAAAFAAKGFYLGLRNVAKERRETWKHEPVKMPNGHEIFPPESGWND